MFRFFGQKKNCQKSKICATFDHFQIALVINFSKPPSQKPYKQGVRYLKCAFSMHTNGEYKLPFATLASPLQCKTKEITEQKLDRVRTLAEK